MSCAVEDKPSGPKRQSRRSLAAYRLASLAARGLFADIREFRYPQSKYELPRLFHVDPWRVYDALDELERLGLVEINERGLVVARRGIG